MRSTLIRYKIGLGIIGLFTIGLLVVVLVQASATKQDTVTYHKASSIADKLQAYTLEQNEVPASLAAAHIRDVPSTVSYTKLSSSSYRFCVTYKATSSNFDATSAISSVASARYGSAYADPATGQIDPTTSSYLYITASHHKGANCQTIKADIFPSNYYQGGCGYSVDACAPDTPLNSYTQ